MSKLIVEPTTLAQWHGLLKDAEAYCDTQLDEDMESYLAFTLMRYTENTELASRAIALDYLLSAEMHGQARQKQLREVGDHCLILAGLFPKRAEHRMVRVSYYVNLGRSSYNHLGHQFKNATAALYQRLAEHFVPMMDILHTIRRFAGTPAMQPLQAFELWSDTGSRAAYQQLINEHNGLPLAENQITGKKNLRH